MTQTWILWKVDMTHTLILYYTHTDTCTTSVSLGLLYIQYVKETTTRKYQNNAAKNLLFESCASHLKGTLVDQSKCLLSQPCTPPPPLPLTWFTPILCYLVYYLTYTSHLFQVTPPLSPPFLLLHTSLPMHNCTYRHLNTHQQSQLHCLLWFHT